MRYAFLSALALGALVAATPAQTCQLVKDINAVSTPISSSPSGARFGPGNTWVPGFLKLGSFWYFTATTVANGSELWRTDGTLAGTTLVKDINPGASSSSISYLVACGSTLFFRATDTANGSELWKSDGTAAGTVLVKDINPGATSSSPAYLECLGGKVYFSANDGSNGTELWCSDGTAAGTVLVADLYTGTSSSSPQYLKANSAGTEIYFSAFVSGTGGTGRELYKTDGTAAGTVLLLDIYTGTSSSSPTYLVNFAGKTLFRATSGTNGSELWSTDGTTAGTTMLKDINSGTAGSSPYLYYSEGAVLGGDMYFYANDGATGSELWKTDGTTAGTVLVADLYAGTSSSSPSNYQLVGSTLYFTAFVSGTGGTGRELWKTDGTVAGTVLVKDIYTGTSSSSPSNLIDLGTNVLFSAFVSGTGGTGRELWISDGTAAGTVEVKDIYTGASSSSPSWLTQVGSVVMFGAADATNGRELWISTGVAATTVLFKDIEPAARTASASPFSLGCSNGETLYFEADDGLVGDELWKSDGTAAGTVLVKDINAGTLNSDPAYFTDCWVGTRQVTLFAATEAASGRELWVTDGTAAGTVLLKDINPGTTSSSPNNLVCCNNRLYFTANDGSNGTELWTSDGTPAGTVLVADINTGSASSSPSYLTCLGGKLYFSALEPTAGRELWTSDGTAAGTAIVADIYAGTSSSSPTYITAVGSMLAFRATNTGTGTELYKSDGTAAGTAIVADIYAGSSSSSPLNLTACGGTLYFAANDGSSGSEVFKSDLTAAGTGLVADLATGTASSSPTNLTCADGKLFFTAFVSGVTGRELYVSDGTPAGTVLLKDIYAGSSSSSPGYITPAGKGVYFYAFNNVDGGEVWFSDGTAAGTNLFCDIYPGSSSSSPAYLTICGGKLFFRATDQNLGSELHAIPLPGASVEHRGEGCAPYFATMTSTHPVLGTTAVLSGTGAPAPKPGAIILGFGITPVPLLLSPPCANYIDLSGPFLSVGVVTTATWAQNLPIPNSATLNGGQVNCQTYFVDGTPLPLNATNAVQLNIGN